MMHPLDGEVVAQRRRQLLKEARIQQALRAARHDPSAADRWLALLGDVLVKSGLKLRARAEKPSTEADAVALPGLSD
jgi:hypothetical protein